MNDSYVMISSMSPKVNGPVSRQKKVTKLALRKYFRRSLAFDNSVVADENVLSKETDSLSSKSIEANDEVIVINDSFEVNEEPETPQIKLSKTKRIFIEDWINHIDENCPDNTVFSELSTIIGDVDGIKAGKAFNSTCLVGDEVKLDQLFDKKKKSPIKAQQNEDKENHDILETSICNTPTNKNYEEECAQLLDSIYGKNWRKNQEAILPKTEIKKKKPEAKTRSKTERKPKLSNLYKNPYLDRDEQPKQILKPLHNNSNLERIKALCDSESSPEQSPEKNLSELRTKLDFDDLGTKRRISKYFEKPNSDKKNDSFDSSIISESLEDRIKKKLNQIPNKKPSKIIKSKINKIVDSESDSDTPKKIDNFYSRREPIKSSSSSTISNDSTINPKTNNNKERPKNSFLSSLSNTVPINECEMSARIFRANYQKYKKDLAIKLFKMYNEEVFDNAIPDDTPLEWNERMRGSAGYCYCKKITRKNGEVQRSVRIVLATKVVDAAYRLRDTLIHEMCHAATWIVNQVSDGHGVFWKAWAAKAMKTYPELPPIKRCHEYEIKTKYTYKCVDCGYSFGRHTKSLNTERKVCGYCKGRFEVLINKVSKKGEVKTVPVTPKREPTAFAKYVQENYALYRTPQMKHADVMRLLGQKFGEAKLDD